MEEIRSLPWNGYNVVSTFSGGGGSCLGYRMAGFRVLWANEFIPEAQKTYAENHADTYLNRKNIREVTPDEVLSQSGMEKGEIDIFDGSPPCSAFSTAGAREKHWGDAKKYSDTVERVDDLFYEYARLVEGCQPKTFVAENVSGLVKGTAKGYFKRFLARLEACGYRVSARLLDAKFLGVPQSRERLIFVGVRKDLCEKFGVFPVHPRPEPRVFTLADAFADLEVDRREADALLEEAKKYAWLGVLKKMPKNPRKFVTGQKYTNGVAYFNLVRESFYCPCSTVLQASGGPSNAGIVHPTEDRKFTIGECKRIMSVPDDFVLTGTRQQQWERLGRMVPPLMMRRIAATIKTEILDKIKERE